MTLSNFFGWSIVAGVLAEARTRGEVLERELRQLGFADGTFDVVWCNAVLRHFLKASARFAVRELRRVAKAEARAVFSVQQGTGEG
jgi:ubiquinone/menaquinone biosynthesis C-methylase UbiE